MNHRHRIIPLSLTLAIMASVPAMAQGGQKELVNSQVVGGRHETHVRQNGGVIETWQRSVQDVRKNYRILTLETVTKTVKEPFEIKIQVPVMETKYRTITATRSAPGEAREETTTESEAFQVQKTRLVYTPAAHPLRHPGVPAPSEIVNGNQKTVTKLRTSRDEAKHGTWVTVTTTLYTGIRNVVAIYRERSDRWLSQLQSHSVTYTTYRGIPAVYNYDLVVSTIAKLGWNKLENVVRANGSRNAILLDAATGEIVGHVPIFNGSWNYANMGLVGRTYGFETEAARQNAAQFKNGGIETIPLANGTSITVNMVGFAYQGSPILLDLGGLGHPDLLAKTAWQSRPDRQAVASALRPFDLDGMGGVAWEWVGPKSGLLVWDPEHKGQIASGKQLFGNYTWGKRWKDGYEPLATIDKNGDGRLAGAELAPLGVWVDADSDGACQPGEVKRLATYGIESVSVKAERDRGGNAMAKAGFVRRLADGRRQTLPTWDWISMGLAKASDGVYCWVGNSEGKDIGGFLKLGDHSGQLQGVSFPTLGNELIEKDLLVGLPLSGQIKDGKVRWGSSVPGGMAESEAIIAEHGKRLFGHTKVTTDTKHIEYDWQADLVKGSPIGSRMASGEGV